MKRELEYIKALIAEAEDRGEVLTVGQAAKSVNEYRRSKWNAEI